MRPVNSSKDSLPKFHVIVTVILMNLVCSWSPSWAAPSDTGLTPEDATSLIREAAHATDLAWEEFHAAAIGGTLASPEVQVTIERQLHEARGLLMKARMAKRDGQYDVVEEISQAIQAITQNIIKASQERKQ